jgi:hypothetical protein
MSFVVYILVYTGYFNKAAWLKQFYFSLAPKIGQSPSESSIQMVDLCLKVKFSGIQMAPEYQTKLSIFQMVN